MRVLLIQPPYELQDDDERQAVTPLGLAYIAATLEREHHEVNIIDCVAEDFSLIEPISGGRRRHGLSDADLASAISEFAPEVVGISCLFSSQASSAHSTCAVVKAVNPNIVTVLGGAHPSAVPGDVLSDSNVDYVVIGEGEVTMLHLLNALESKQRSVSQVAGLAYQKENQVRINQPRKPLEDLDWLPLPARHLLPMDKYFRYRSPHGGVVKRDPCTNVLTSRGCPAGCSFCSIHTVWGKKFRPHSADRVLRELETLVADYGVREVQFEDDNISLNKMRMHEICKGIIERGLDLTWTTPNGLAIWACDEETLALMRAAGCHHIAIAVESGCQRVLRDIIHKPLKLERVPGIVRTAHKLGMGVSAFFVVGFPGETREEIQQTFNYAMQLGVDRANFFTATPFPGTALFKQCVDEGMLASPVDYSKLRVGRPTFSTDDWTAEELQEMVRAAQARFFRKTAMRRPIHFMTAVAKKLARDPSVTLRRAWDTLLTDFSHNAADDDLASTDSLDRLDHSESDLTVSADHH